jgi:hypothetical protein
MKTFWLLLVAALSFVGCDISAAGACDHRCQAVHWFLASSLTTARQQAAYPVALSPHSMCVIDHESRHAGLFAAYDGTGNYGAYQFAQRTFDHEAARAGRPDLIGKPPVEPFVPWWDQVRVYLETYRDQGDAPWGGRCP